jgi:hypothetical protein
MNQYIEAYSDDICYLRDARELLLNDRTKIRNHDWIEASFCRLLVIHIVGSTEMMIEKWWSELPPNPFEEGYRRWQGSHYTAKLSTLINVFNYYGLSYDVEIVKDFIAIILLRNRIAHSSGKKDSRDQYIIERGFPLDVMALNTEHWNKMCQVYELIMQYIAFIWLKHKKPTE